MPLVETNPLKTLKKQRFSGCSSEGIERDQWHDWLIGLHRE